MQQNKLFRTSTSKGLLRSTKACRQPGFTEWGFDSASLHLWTEGHFRCSQKWWVRWRVWAEGASWRAGWGEWPGGSGISPHTCRGWNTYLRWCRPLLPGWGNGPGQWDFHGTWNAPPSSLKTSVGICFSLLSIALKAFHSHSDRLWIHWRCSNNLTQSNHDLNQVSGAQARKWWCSNLAMATLCPASLSLNRFCQKFLIIKKYIYKSLLFSTVLLSYWLKQIMVKLLYNTGMDTRDHRVWYQAFTLLWWWEKGSLFYLQLT